MRISSPARRRFGVHVSWAWTSPPAKRPAARSAKTTFFMADLRTVRTRTLACHRARRDVVAFVAFGDGVADVGRGREIVGPLRPVQVRPPRHRRVKLSAARDGRHTEAE